MLALFAVAIFSAAALLFVVQPLVGRLVLPLLGGSPSVWNTTMVFFQAALLVGYLYAHLLTRLRSAKAQVAVHAGLLLLTAIALPIGLPAGTGGGGGGGGTSAAGALGATSWFAARSDAPIMSTILIVAATVGLPFLVISTAGPLLQKWFSATDHPAAKDPYFLYAASNAGSMLALIAYPLLIEPWSTLTQQRVAWSIGFGVFAVLAVACGVTMLGRRSVQVAEPATGAMSPAAATDPGPSTPARNAWIERGHWTLLALGPSSLLLGTTQHLTTDVAAFPLMWIIPLALYLVTFIVAFTAWADIGPVWTLASRWLMLPAALALPCMYIADFRSPLWVLLAAHLAFLLLAAQACHGRLAALRPSPARLTEFYLCMSLGGVLGGLFSAVVAPQVFNHITEFTLAALLCCYLGRPGAGSLTAGRAGAPAEPGNRAMQGIRLATTILVPIVIVAVFWQIAQRQFPFNRFTLPTTLMLAWLVPGLMAAAFMPWRGRYVAALAAVFFCAKQMDAIGTRQIYIHRSFFGVLRVFEDRYETQKHPEWKEANRRTLYHGRIIHGRQFLAEHRRQTPSTYYHRAGPLGDLFTLVEVRANRAANAAPDSTGDSTANSPADSSVPPPRAGGAIHAGLIGLGTGTTAAYGSPTVRLTYYEIDPAVVALAQNPNLFTYVADARARGGEVNFIVGDARLTIANTPAGTYDLLAVDAFSSDAIPLHLITREAIKLFVDRLKPDGLLAMHVSNRYMELEPVLGNLARDMGLASRVRSGGDDRATDGFSSTWVVLARDEKHLGTLLEDPNWTRVPTDEKVGVWTDDYANVLSVFSEWRAKPKPQATPEPAPPPEATAPVPTSSTDR